MHLRLEAMSYYLQVLFSLHDKLEPAAQAGTPKRGAPPPPLGSAGHVQLIAAAAEYRLVSFCLHVLRDYLRLRERSVGGADGAARELCATALAEMTPNVVTLLQGLLAFSGPQFGKHLPAFYPLLADLIHCESPQIAAVLRELFAQRVAPHLQAEAS